MERDDLASLAGFFADAPRFVAGDVVRVGEEAAHHMRVRRLEVGSRVHLTNGAGAHAIGSIARLDKRDADVTISNAASIPRPADVRLLVPIADRDRMLWLAEKSTELEVTSWRPVMWSRSRSVSPRGEGPSFSARVAGRMRAALIQSHGAWLPEVCPDAHADAAVAALPPGGTRLVLDAAGEPIARAWLTTPVTIAVGPEGGLELDELRLLTDAGFHRVSLGPTILRFETAAVAAVAIVRSMLIAAHLTSVATTPTTPGRIDG